MLAHLFGVHAMEFGGGVHANHRRQGVSASCGGVHANHRYHGVHAIQRLPQLFRAWLHDYAGVLVDDGFGCVLLKKTGIKRGQNLSFFCDVICRVCMCLQSLDDTPPLKIAFF